MRSNSLISMHDGRLREVSPLAPPRHKKSTWHASPPPRGPRCSRRPRAFRPARRSAALQPPPAAPRTPAPAHGGSLHRLFLKPPPACAGHERRTRQQRGEYLQHQCSPPGGRGEGARARGARAPLPPLQEGTPVLVPSPRAAHLTRPLPTPPPPPPPPTPAPTHPRSRRQAQRRPGTRRPTARSARHRGLRAQAPRRSIRGGRSLRSRSRPPWVAARWTCCETMATTRARRGSIPTTKPPYSKHCATEAAAALACCLW